MDVGNDFVNVAVRVRPLMKSDVKTNLKVFHDYPSVLCVLDRQQKYSFDNIFDETADQNAVFSTTIKPMIDKLLLGYNCTVFAYGQTGTGKTYTLGNQDLIEDDMGMISRTFKELFENVNKQLELSVEVSVYEIYNEKVYDLLGDTKDALRVKGFSVNALKRTPIKDLTTAEDLLCTAGKNRHTSGTRQNANSSRSHAIYTLYCSITSSDTVINAKFNFVDLAGSESVRKTGNEGPQFSEGVNINMGLLCIGQVISALSTNKNYVPYRQSIITTVLQDSLKRTNTIAIIACVSANPSDSTETIQTLEFAKNAKKVVSRPEINSAVNQYFKANPVTSTAKKNRASETPRFVTPMKRPMLYPTSTVLKRPRPLHSTLIDEVSTVSDGTTLARRRSPSGFNISGFSEIQEPPPINYSPIVRKCVNVLEAALLSKIDLMINEKLQRRSARISTNLCKGCETTSRNGDESQKLEKEKIVTKSPVVSRILRDITPIHRNRKKSMEGNRNEGANDNLAGPRRTPIFKVPYVPLTRLTPEFIARKTSSPVESEDCKPFTSVDLSTGGNFSLGTAGFFANDDTKRVPLRRSVRVSIKPQRYSSEVTIDLPKGRKRRRSTMKQSENFVARKKLKGEGDTADKHTSYVLQLLNSGTAKNLQSLHTIGQKTAQQIVLYRDIRGKFSEIEDLRNVLKKGRGYERFIQENFLI